MDPRRQVRLIEVTRPLFRTASVQASGYIAEFQRLVVDSRSGVILVYMLWMVSRVGFVAGL